MAIYPKHEAIADQVEHDLLTTDWADHKEPSALEIFDAVADAIANLCPADSASPRTLFDAIRTSALEYLEYVGFVAIN